MAKLIVNPTSAFRREVPLQRSILSIGRDPSNDVVLPDAMVSRRHAVVECRGMRYVFRDCNSSNGSAVNGDRVAERDLRDGDLVAIGSARLLFRDDVEVIDASGKVLQHPSAPRLECPSCRAGYRLGDVFCRQCGGPLPAQAGPAQIVCAACGVVLSLPARFCSACGAPLAPAEADAAPQPDGRAPALPVTTTEELPSPEDLAPRGGPASPAPAGPPDREPAPAPESPSAGKLSPRGSGNAAVAISLVDRPWPAPVARRAGASPRPRVDSLQRPSPHPGMLAPFGVRLLAGLLDAGILAIAVGLLLAGVVWHWSSRDLRAPADVSFPAVALSVAAVAAALLVSLGYHVCFWGVRGRTPGQALLDLEVQTDDGLSPIGVGRAAKRLFGYGLSGASFGVGFLMIALSGSGLHDRIARTRVVRRGPPA
jgi:uncharacterized RDD family membrane protein YckC